MDRKFEKLKTIIAEKFGVSDDLITMNAELAADLNLSPLEITDLIGYISNEFDLNIQDDIDLKDFVKVADLYNLIEEYSLEL